MACISRFATAILSDETELALATIRVMLDLKDTSTTSFIVALAQPIELCSLSGKCGVSSLEVAFFLFLFGKCNHCTCKFWHLFILRTKLAMVF